MIWILIAYVGSTAGMYSHDFATKEHCEFARNKLIEARLVSKEYAICVPSGFKAEPAGFER